MKYFSHCLILHFLLLTVKCFLLIVFNINLLGNLLIYFLRVECLELAKL